MFLKLRSYDPLLSYKIVKNPDKVFEKEITSERKVRAYYQSDNTEFVAILENSDELFIKKLKDLNADTYVSSLQYAVTPHNLQLFMTVFTSVISGNKGDKNLTDEEFLSLDFYELFTGPFIYIDENLVKVLQEKTELSIEFIKLGTIYFVNFANRDKTTLTKFLQNVYAACYIFSAKTDIFNIFSSETKQEQLLKFASWLADEDANKIVKKLSKYKKETLAVAIKVFQLEDDFTSLHTKRLQIAANLINRDVEQTATTVLDLGCGTMQLLDYITPNKNLKYLGLEKNPKRINPKIKQTDILTPIIRDTDLQPDWLILSEVIEHLDETNRKQLIELIITLYQPNSIFISTPNVEYNINYGLTDGEFRHKDHKIEFTLEQFTNEIILPLENAGYNVSVWNVLPEETLQPSFIITAHYYGNERKPDYKLLERFRSKAEPIYLPFNGHKIKRSTIERGLLNDEIKGAFFYGPTIAPVEYSEKYPDVLEHIYSAFDYYTERGFTDLIVEEKVMGSRAYILAYRDELYAKGAPLIDIRSRKNFQFFDDQEILMKVHAEIFANLPDNINVIMLDCEITPWAFKAEKLITQKFLQPVEAAFYQKTLLKENTAREEKFLDTLSLFSKTGDIQITVFDILLYATNTLQLSYLTRPKLAVNQYIHTWFSGLEIIKPIQYILVNTYEQKDKQAAENFFNALTKGEGVVVKPVERFKILSNGYLLQPALKVRNQNYLQLIYGVNYLDYLDMLSKRNIKRKRQQAILEYELSVNMLLTFTHPQQRTKYLAAFSEIERENLRYIDATL